MITQEEYDSARAQKESAEKIINAFWSQKLNNFADRWKRFEEKNEYFHNDDLVYSAGARCKCGEGLAYPKDCGPNHQWTCSGVLTGRKNDNEHDAFPFAFYEIKSENQPSAKGNTTRPQ